jgi:hypothetical protein
MVWLPAVSTEVVNVAWAPPGALVSVPVPIVELPSRNVTVPVGVPPDPGTGETVAVKTTGWPAELGFGNDVTVVVVAVCACAAANDSSDIAHASAAAPIARRSFRLARDARNTLAPSARTDAPRSTCHAVVT